MNRRRKVSATKAVLLVIGMLVLFWAVLVNTFYGIWLYQSYMRELAAKRHKVLPYDAEKDVPYVQDCFPFLLRFCSNKSFFSCR